MTTVSDITPPLELAIPKRYASTQEVADRRAAFYAALRSGQYKQGQLALRWHRRNEEPQYCCLGVACEVSKLSEWRVDAEGSWYLETRNLLPERVAEFYEFSTDAGMLVDLPPSLRRGFGRVYVSPIVLNDDWGFDFAQIAECFEATYPAEVQPDA